MGCDDLEWVIDNSRFDAGALCMCVSLGCVVAEMRAGTLRTNLRRVSSDQNSSLQDFSHIARGAGSLGGALERLSATRPEKPQIDYMTMSVFCSPL